MYMTTKIYSSNKPEDRAYVKNLTAALTSRDLSINLEIGDPPAGNRFDWGKDTGPSTVCMSCDDHAKQKLCWKYEKASHVERCTWLIFEEFCTWRKV